MNHLIAFCRNGACGISCGGGLLNCTCASMLKAVDRMRMTFMHGFLKLNDEASVRINHLIAICHLSPCSLCHLVPSSFAVCMFRKLRG